MRIKHSLVIAMALFSLQGLRAQNDYNLENFTSLLYHIQEMYVDSVVGEQLIEDAMVGMLEKLDPHSIYIPADEVRAMNEPLKGNFDGVGIQFNILKDTIFVVSPISGGPSEKVGIMAGDRIIEVDGEACAGIGVKNSDVQRLLKGPKGTVVNVVVVRRGSRKTLDFDITRDKIPLFSMDAHYMADPETGYIKINRFAATTMDEMSAALVDLKSKGMKNLILDLQGNGGGYLRTAIAMADEFLSDDELIVFTEGRAFPKNETFATSNGTFKKGKLAVLIDEGSASASEIVSGAVQDWDRGVIIGRRSFGKGLVQKPVYLPDGAAVRLTTQEYFTPSGRCIQKPYDEGKDAYRKERVERFEKGELMSLENLEMPDSIKFYTKVNNRVVYGAGGIIPDIFVPLDTTWNSEYYSQAVRKGIMNGFVLSYANDNRTALEAKYPTVQSYIDGFSVEKEVMKDFFAYAKKEDLEKNEADYKKSKEIFDLRIKAMIARSLFDTSAYYQVINPALPVYKKAMKVMGDDTFKRLNLAQN